MTCNYAVFIDGKPCTRRLHEAAVAHNLCVRADASDRKQRISDVSIHHCTEPGQAASSLCYAGPCPFRTFPARELEFE